MSIQWNDGKTTHVGCVIGNPFTLCERVMSDIYANTHHIWVFNPGDKSVSTVQVSSAFELDHRVGKWDADVETGEFAQDYQDYLAEQEVKAAEREKARKIEDAKWKEAEAKKELLKPDKGRKAKVVSGRKVPKGTIGDIFWVGDKGYGETVGIKDSQNNVHWTASSNVVTTGWGLDFGQDPVGMTWLELSQEIRKAEEVARKNSRLPFSGDKVREKKNLSNIGVVFWVKDQRVGFKTNPKADPTWADMTEVDYYDNQSQTWKDYAVATPVYPDFAAPQKSVAPSSNPTNTNTQPEPPKTANNPFESYPAPFCDIRQITRLPDGWAALDGEGSLITLLDEDTAKQLGGMLV